MIELRGVSKSFGPTRAIERFELAVERGERVALVGPSGCGKTTVLRIIAGLELPDAGEVLLGGTVATGPGVSVAPHERGIGYVPQTAALFPSMDVRGNIAYGLHAMSRDSRAQRVDELLDAFGLAELERRAVHELSGGQTRRVALARALAPRPARLLLDEPLANLDRDARETLLSVIEKAVRGSHASLLYVTHEFSEARRLSARVVTMEP